MSSAEDLSESTSFCYQGMCSGHTPVFWYYVKKTWLYRLQMSHDMIQLDFWCAYTVTDSMLLICYLSIFLCKKNALQIDQLTLYMLGVVES